MLYRFTLTYSGNDTVVDEPSGFTDFESEIKRDFDAHGLVYQFTSGTLKLGFSGTGRTVLETAFQNDGFDAVVTLKVEQRERSTDSWEVIFNGTAIMENRTYNRDFFEVDFENSTFQQKVVNRIKTKVRLDATEDLDGNAIVGSISEQSTAWNEIRLNRNYIADFRTGADSSTYQSYNKSHLKTNGDPVYLHLMLNFSGTIQEDLRQWYEITESINNDQLSAVSGDQNIISEIGGTAAVEGTLKYRFHGTFTTTAASGTQSVKLRWYLRHENGLGAFQSQTEVLIETLSSASTTFNFDSGVLTETIPKDTIASINPGDYLFFYAECEGDSTGAGGSDTNTLNATIEVYNSSRIDMSVLKAGSDITVRSYLIHDVIEWILYLITGENNRLNSDFLGLTELGYAANGCGGPCLITNGAQLRGINNALEISLKEVLDSISAIHGTGWGFEKDYNNDYVMRVELMEHFYADAEILDLGSPVDNVEIDTYEENTFDPLVLNNCIVGYKKFSSDEDFDGDLDDFLTQSEYALPISSVKGDLSKISPLIASGRLIQASFEKADDTTKTWKLDNNNFIVAAVDSGGNWVPENDQNFTTVTGLDDSTTAYNIRYAPVYMFLNQSLILNSAMFGKDVTKEYKNVSVEINKDFDATLDSADACPMGDVPTQSRSATGNISILNALASQRIWKPIEISGTYAATNAQVNSIIDAMENNNSDSSKNLGYVTMKDNEGANKQVFILDMSWNYLDEIIKIRGVEQADNYAI